MNRSFSLVREVAWLPDESIVYEDDQVICLMRLFPVCRDAEPMSPEHYRSFHLRLYLPRRCLTDANQKIDRVVVMTNGLDEVAHFDLYDQLGTRLASAGVASILLPLPDHLNRHTRFRIKNPTWKQLVDKPSIMLMDRPISLYDRYLQFKGELHELVRHLRAEPCGWRKGTCSFYSNVFSPNLRISYLGYSLGAAAMLSDFLERRDDLNACFLLSGAIVLRDIVPEEMFSASKWEEFTSTLEEGFRRDSRFREDELDLTNRLFEAVFLGHYADGCRKLLRECGRRVLFVFGGRDQMISIDQLQAITPREWGLGVVVLPGINHFLAINEEWKRWVELVVRLLVDYERNAARQTITMTDVLDRWERSRGGCADEATMETDPVVARASLIGFEPKEFSRGEEEKRKLKQEIGKTDLRELRIGEMAWLTNLITFSELQLAIERQKESQRLMGNVLVNELRLLTDGQRNALAAAQVKRG